MCWEGKKARSNYTFLASPSLSLLPRNSSFQHSALLFAKELINRTKMTFVKDVLHRHSVTHWNYLEKFGEKSHLRERRLKFEKASGGRDGQLPITNNFSG